jgi:chromosome segregation ATPase
MTNVAEDIRHRQDHIEFLENYITEITEKIDELTGGRDIVKRIDSLEYRIVVLGKAGTDFQARIGQLQKELKALRDEYEKIKPMIEELEVERAYYRHLQSELL